MLNAYRTAEYLIRNGVPRESLQLLYIIAPTPGGPDVIRPNANTLRPEEQQRAKEKGKEVQWAYHSAVMTKKEKKVFDLFSDKSNWGKNLDEFMVETFLDEIVEGKKGVEVSELRARGEDNEGGMSSIWMLQNKPEDEWYWKK